MSGKQQAMEIVMELIKNGPVKSYDLLDIGFSSTTTNNALSQLVKEGRIVRHGHASASFYTLNGMVAEKPTKREIRLPELPPIILNWMGYTDLTPKDPVYVQGYMSRGAE